MVAERLYLADSFLARLKGLLGEDEIPVGSGLLIPSCKSVHTIGMSFTIDVAFVDSSNRVVAVYDSLAPLRMTRVVFRADSAVELPSGRIREVDLKPGDLLHVGH